MRMLDTSSSKSDTPVSLSDQQSINSFSRFSHLVDECGESLKKLREEREELEEVEMELELLDEDEVVRYKLDSTFIHLSPSKALEYCTSQKEKIETEIEGLNEKVDECEKGMKDLKVILYAKFGQSINLEKGDD